MMTDNTSKLISSTDVNQTSSTVLKKVEDERTKVVRERFITETADEIIAENLEAFKVLAK